LPQQALKYIEAMSAILDPLRSGVIKADAVIHTASNHDLRVPVVSMTPEQAAEHLGWLGVFVGLDIQALRCEKSWDGIRLGPA
jgi:hypothetical protein